jgi:hypothetical protein
LTKFIILLVSFLVVGILPSLKYIDESVLFSNSIAEGFGRTVAVGLLSCFDLLYKPNKNFGFGIAAGIFSILILIAGLQQGSI